MYEESPVSGMNYLQTITFYYFYRLIYLLSIVLKTLLGVLKLPTIKRRHKTCYFLFCFYVLQNVMILTLSSVLFMWILPTEKNENNTNYIKFGQNCNNISVGSVGIRAIYCSCHTKRSINTYRFLQQGMINLVKKRQQ